MKPLISVIIPIYNAEKYLEKCINSILKSPNLKEIEILLINDGSTDSSGNICDEYSQKYKNIKTYHKSNGGVSSARNIGLDYAQGTWIHFMDADDYVDPDFFIIEDKYSKADIIEKSYTIINSEYSEIITKSIKPNILNKKYDIVYYFINYRTNALWNKFIKRAIIADRRFNVNIRIGEDFLFLLSILNKIQSYSFSGIGKYNYLIREDSAMGCINKNIRKKIDTAFYNMKMTKEICIKERIPNNIYNSILIVSYTQNLLKKSYFTQLNSKEKSIVLKDLHTTSYHKLKYVRLKYIIKIYLYKLYFIHN